MRNCVLCGTELSVDDQRYRIDIMFRARPGTPLAKDDDRIWADMAICEGCLDQPIRDLAEFARQYHEDRQFAAQAEREVTELTRDPDGCQEWIREKWPATPGHYCTRKAVAWGYCKQHLWTHGIDAKTGQRKYPELADRRQP